MERNVLILPSNKHPSLILGSCLNPHYYTKHSTTRKEKKKISRRFEEKWASHSSCETIIQEAWSTKVGRGSPMVVLFERIKKCRFALVEWSRVAFGSSKTLLKEKQHRLEELCSQNNFEFLDEIKEVKADINNILHQDEIFWRK